MGKTVFYEKKENGIYLITIHRPEALNALNEEVLTELYEVMDLLDKDSSVRVIILTGAGEKSFVAGGDISLMKGMDLEKALKFAQKGHKTMNRVAAMNKIVIAAINGFALGGGCELAAACDIRIADEKAKMGIPEVVLGVIPGFGGTQRISRLIGKGYTMEMLATGDKYPAQECLKMGLVNRVVPQEQLIDSCMEMAEKIAANSRNAIAVGKKCVSDGLDMSLADGLELEQKEFASIFGSEDQIEGMNAFLGKRKANFVN